MAERSTYEVLKCLCEKRKSHRSFLNRPVPQEYIENIKQIAYTSPYVSGKKNWEIITIDSKVLIKEIAETIIRCSDTIREKIRPDFKESYTNYARNFTVFESAPVLFIPTFRVTPALSIMMKKKQLTTSEWERDNYVKSISCVAMLILLAAESLNLGSCYMTGPLIAKEEIGRLVNIKNGRSIGALIPVGYPKKEDDNGS